MRNGKVVIANDFAIMRNYVENGVDGVLLDDLRRQLKPTVQAIETDPDRFGPIRTAALARFERDYSQDALERRMSHLIQDQWIQDNPSAQRRAA